jgi:hypothetical protein
LAGGATDAEDIVQDACMPALEALDSAPGAPTRMLAVVRNPLKRGSPEIVQVQSSWSIGAPNAAMQASQETVCRSLETTSAGCESRADWQASDRSGFAVRSQPVSNEAVVKPEGNPPGGIP